MSELSRQVRRRQVLKLEADAMLGWKGKRKPEVKSPLRAGRSTRKSGQDEDWMYAAPCPVCGVFKGERCVRMRGEKGGRAGTHRQNVHRERKAAAREARRAAGRGSPARRSVNDQVAFSRRQKFNLVKVEHVQPVPKVKRDRKQVVESNLARLKREAEQRMRT